MSIFTGKRVVVTGGAGMVGSHLVELLLQHGADVVVIDDLSRGKTWVPGSHILRVDAGEPRALVGPFAKTYAVFNLAATVAGVIYNQQNHLEMYHRNERLQTAPLIAAEQAGVEHFLQVSSVCVYGEDYNSPAEELNGWAGEPVNANNGYSWAKRIGERAALWSKIPHVVIVRPSNLYGPRDYFDDRAHVIPALIKKALHDDVIRVNGTGYERREFLYVEDAARGMLAALERGQHQAAYNLGSRGLTCVSIRELVALIQEATDTLDKPVEFARDYDAGDAARWSLGYLAEQDLVWQHTVPLAEGIKQTVAWYKEHS